MKRLLFFILIILFQFTNHYAEEGGYVNKVSVTKGDTIKFYISTEVSPFYLAIFQVKETTEFITQFDDIDGGLQEVPDSSFWYGCNWNESISFVIPQDWEPGVYRAEFPISIGEGIGVLFYVKEENLGSHSNILLLGSTNTWQAYNNFGGKSLYDNQSTNGQRSYKVSFNRPAALPLGNLGSADFYRWEIKFINWAYSNNYQLEFASKKDLDNDPEFLSNYQVVFIVGHNEYWSYDERLQVQNWVDDGGKLIILSGNTSWWQVRLEDNGNTMVCYKDKNLDPLYGVTDSLVTVNWWDDPVLYPENIMTGVSFRNGGYVNSGDKLPASEGYGDYAAFNTHHWIFEGTGLEDGDEFGYSSTIVGYEADGAAFSWNNGVPKPTGIDGTQHDFVILGLSPAINYDPSVTGTHGTMGFFHGLNGGTVFNASTTDWVDGLADNDPVVDRITKNVLHQFLEIRLPPYLLGWHPANVEVENINNEFVFINNRDFLVAENETLELWVSTRDFYYRPVDFAWTVDGVVMGNDSTFTYANDGPNPEPDKTIIKAYFFNDVDSASISWNAFNSELVIKSNPDTAVGPTENYNYNVEVFNYYEDDLSFELFDSPNWLSVNNDGVISGTAPSDTGIYQVNVKVTNQHFQSDEQSYLLNVTNTATSVKEDENIVSEFKLYQNYPNPFNPATVIKYSIPERTNVKIIIHDLLGNKIITLVDQEKLSGSYEVRFNAQKYNLSSGIYFYSIMINHNKLTRKMIFLK